MPPVETKKQVIEAVCKSRLQLQRLGIRRLGLFGSFAREEQHQDSDVDFLAEFEAEQKTFDHFMGLSFLLEDALKRRVEVVTPESLSPHIAPRILREVEYVFVAS